jgi:CRISPR system Cascade subunit CasC
MTSRSKFTGMHLRDLVVELLTATDIEVTDDVIAEATKLSLAETKKLTTKEKKVTASKKVSVSKKTADKDADETDDGKKDADEGDTLIWLAESEMRSLAHKIVSQVAGVGAADVDFSGWVQPSTSSLTIAGFGRMFANAPMVQTEAAVQLAHAFTTHEAITEIDYFTAVDDLRASVKADAGAGHLDLAEFTSGVFYRYLNIDRRQLRENWIDITEADAHQRLAEWLSTLLLSLPSGKANSTAPLTLPYLVIIEESAVPVSFADAFEAAVIEAGDGFAAPSRERLLDYRARSGSVAGSIFGDSVVLDLTGEDAQSSTLLDLIEFAVSRMLRAE